MSGGNEAAAGASLATTVAAGEDKPRLCENCEKREPVEAVMGVKQGALGIDVEVWLCGTCAGVWRAAQEEAEREAKKKRKAKPKKGRIATGRYGTTILTWFYRWGGMTARQLGELLLMEFPGRFLSKPGDAGERAYQAAREALTLLRHNKLLGSLGIRREYAVGERQGRVEEYYHLSGAGVIWGASRNGVTDAEEARKAYKLHQLPHTPEHSAYRNGIFLRWLRDTRVLHAEAVAGGEVERRADEVVVPEPGVGATEAFFGETFGRFPLLVARFLDEHGRETTRRGHKWEKLHPDGRARFVWADGLVGEFCLEAELESKTREASKKVDRYGAYWLRLYKEMEREAHAAERQPIAEELEGVLERRREMIMKQGYRAGDLSGHDRLGGRNIRRLEAALAEIDARRVAFLGLPPGVRPVVFCHQTAAMSEGTRTSLRDRKNYPTPRYDEFREYVASSMQRWAVAEIVAAGQRGEDMEPIENWRDYALRALDSLFVFTSWDGLQPAEYNDEERAALLAERLGELRVEGFEGGEEAAKAEAWRRVREDEVGETLEPVYVPLGAEDLGEGTTLRETAELRRSLRPKVPATGAAGSA